MGGLSLIIDILLKDKIELIQAQYAVARAFNIESSRVKLELSADSTSSIDDNIQALCYLYDKGGDYVQLLSIFIRDETLKCNDQKLAQAISAILNMACLISDDDIDPFTMIMVLPDGTFKNVNLNPDDLDEDRYVVVKN